MKRFRNICFALLIGCCSPVLVWVGAGSALYQNRKRVREALYGLVCGIDADCPMGYACVNGRCVPEPEKAI